MANFNTTNYHQTTMMVVNFEEHIASDPFAFTLHKLIGERIDLSAFYQHYKNDSGGRAAYDPAVLLKIILFCYSKGIRSSRDIEWHCQNNMLLRALCCDKVPHYTTIAHFISAYPEAIETVFEQVLLTCDQQGLLGHDLIAIDGCKISSNAAKEHSGTFKELENKQRKIQKHIQQCMNEHRQLDKRKKSDRSHKQKLEKTLEKLDEHFQKIDHFLKTHRPRKGQGKHGREVKSNITDNESAKLYGSKGVQQSYNAVVSTDKKHQIIVDAQVFGEGNENHTLQPILGHIEERYAALGIDDAIFHSGIVITADTGFYSDANNDYVQSLGINAYTPDPDFRKRDPRYAEQKQHYGSKNKVKHPKFDNIIASSEFRFNKRNKTCVCPQGKTMWLMQDTEVAKGKYQLVFEGKLTDCRHCPIKTRCMRNPQSADTREGHGRTVSFTVTDGRNPSNWMKKRVDSVEGKRHYSDRMAVVEPVFANITVHKKLNRFSLRGKRKVQGQWLLYCLVHNVEKLMKYGQLAY